MSSVPWLYATVTQGCQSFQRLNKLHPSHACGGTVAR